MSVRFTSLREIKLVNNCDLIKTAADDGLRAAQMASEDLTAALAAFEACRPMVPEDAPASFTKLLDAVHNKISAAKLRVDTHARVHEDYMLLVDELSSDEDEEVIDLTGEEPCYFCTFSGKCTRATILFSEEELACEACAEAWDEQFVGSRRRCSGKSKPMCKRCDLVYNDQVAYCPAHRLHGLFAAAAAGSGGAAGAGAARPPPPAPKKPVDEDVRECTCHACSCDEYWCDCSGRRCHKEAAAGAGAALASPPRVVRTPLRTGGKVTKERGAPARSKRAKLDSDTEDE